MLMLDEPTSGLDSASALAVVRFLKNLTHKGHTVVMTIHQPSSQIWTLFDKISFLVAGRHVFFGRRVDVLNYLLAIANRLEIDVEDAFRRKNQTNQGRTW